MMKKLSAAISIVMLVSCASRKTDTLKVITNETKDATELLVTDGVLVSNTNVFRDELLLELEIRPAIDSLPMFIAGVEYKNAILTSKKQRVIVIDTSRLIVSKKVLKTTRVKQAVSSNVKDKVINKQANYFVYLWLLLIPVIVFAYRVLIKR